MPAKKGGTLAEIPEARIGHELRELFGKIRQIKKREKKTNRELRLAICEAMIEAVFGVKIAQEIVKDLRKRIDGIPIDDEEKATYFKNEHLNKMTDMSVAGKPMWTCINFRLKDFG